MSDREKSALDQAASDLYDHFGCGVHPHYIQSIGVAAKGQYNDTDRIHVYLNREPRRLSEEIPETWQGFPVETKVVGPLFPLGGPLPE